MVDAEAELFGGAEHPVGLDAADLAALELQPTGERRADGRKRVGLPCLDVGRAADDFERGAARVHHAEREPVGVGMLLDLEHARDEHVAQVLMDRHDAIDGRDLAREAIGDVLALERAAEQGFEPAAGNYHWAWGLGAGALGPRPQAPPGPANCSRNRTSESKNKRISGMP